MLKSTCHYTNIKVSHAKPVSEDLCITYTRSVVALVGVWDEYLEYLGEAGKITQGKAECSLAVFITMFLSYHTNFHSHPCWR